MIQSAVLWKDDHIIVLNKPPGLASQGGSGQGDRHVDGLTEALKFGYKDRPKMVHGWTRTPRASCFSPAPTASPAPLSESLRHREARKIYWAVVAGVPNPKKGSIKFYLERRPPDAGAAARAKR